MKQIKSLLTLVLVLAVLLCLTACGSGSASVDLTALKEQIVAELNIENSRDIAVDRLTSLYGIAEEDVAENASYVTLSGAFPEEVIILKASSSSAADRMEELLNKRLAEVKNQNEDYDPENYALVQECKVLRNGEYVAMFLSAEHAGMEEIFTAAFAG